MAWFEKFFDGLYRDVLPSTFAHADSRRHARTIRRLLRLRAGQRVLDVPCGMGRIAIPLAGMGLHVTGVDRMASYLRRVRRAARAAGVRVDCVRCDMRHVDFREEFDAAFNWFGSFGYFSDRDNLAFARRVLAALRPGGRFLVEGLNQPWLRRHFRPHSEETIGGVRIVHRRRWDARGARVADTWTMRRGSRVERHRIVIRIYNGPELRTLLQEAGFGETRLYGCPPVGQLTRGARRLIAVARKPRC
jgi:SAM-dependent methyltransferase